MTTITSVITSFSTEDPLIDMTFITMYTGMTDKWFYKLIGDGCVFRPKPTIDSDLIRSHFPI